MRFGKPSKPPNLWITLTLILTLSSLTLFSLGAKLVREERTVLKTQYQRLYYQWLLDYKKEVDLLLTRRVQSIVASIDGAPLDEEHLRAAARANGSVEQHFTLSSKGALLYPLPDNKDLTAQERSFLKRVKPVLREGGLLTRAPAPEAGLQPVPGWHVYYWSDGLHLLYLQQAGVNYLGFELNKSRLLADIIAAVPEEKVDNATTRTSIIRILDEQGEELYRTSAPETRGTYQSVVHLNLSPPLQMLQLSYLVPKGIWDEAFYGSAVVTIIPLVLAVIAVLIILTLYFLKEHAREVEETARRVNFVNQVSHELKTPLTNIRLYAELLEAHLEEDDSYAQGNLEVIVAESQRLTRLITTILDFSLQEKKKLSLHFTKARLDEVIQQVIEHFKLSLQEQQITVRVSSGVSDLCTMDADAANQILGNLIANVLKHAASGRELHLESYRANDAVCIRVKDAGPGVPLIARSRIFEPFYRSPSGQTSGTGIGLSISRELARLHGGDLILEETSTGASFLATLRAPLAGAEQEPEPFNRGARV